MNWKGLLRPSLPKIVVTLLLPAVVALLVTRSQDSVLDFYWYLLTPIMPFYDGTRITYVFNGYILLWVPFYLAACLIVLLFRRRTYRGDAVFTGPHGDPDVSGIAPDRP